MLKKRLAQLRKESKLKQEEVAKIIGVARTTYAMYEQGNRQPDYETLQKLADFFDVSTDYLLGRTDKKKSDWDSKLPELTEKEERDIAKDLEKMLSDMEGEEALAFDGEPMDDETREALRMSLESSMRFAKQLAKQKFTPKKYRKRD